MSLELRRLLQYLLLIGCLNAPFHSLLTAAGPVYSGVTAHEWGTFTSIAGNDGEAAEWLPLTASTDLPGFVEHFRDARFKLGLRGTVRMETPVVYFYSRQEERVSVSVRFVKGVITEWYPRASRVGPTEPLWDGSLSSGHPDGSIAWDAITLTPNLSMDFPKEARSNHYYAARQTTSTPLSVKTAGGEQREKFLFYRGVSDFPVPIAALASETGIPDGKVRVKSRSKEEIANTILFERRGDKLGYRIGGAFHGEATLEPLELSGSVDELGRELERILVSQGLYQNEAQAMVETWRDSWFEEGSRLLYFVPEKFLSSVLPLTINPPPAQMVRVFVGRLELITPTTKKAVQHALATHDGAALAKYGRFLEPILQAMIKNESDAAKLRVLRDGLTAAYAKMWRNAQNQFKN
jgi:hypothetical protein